ncbi:MAG: hypothetical protein M3R72_09455 [Bacteroidota bacterium]|nr:hypothetical protein [Bacteroidota bacterium]
MQNQTAVCRGGRNNETLCFQIQIIIKTKLTYSTSLSLQTITGIQLEVHPKKYLWEIK